MYEQYEACNNCLNRRVALHTLSGGVHEGVIVRVDTQNVYLDTSSNLPLSNATVSSKKSGKKSKVKTSKLKTSALGGGLGYNFRPNQPILTLALFDLLAIALLV